VAPCGCYLRVALRGAAWPLSLHGIARQSSSRGVAQRSCLRCRVAVIFAWRRVPIVFTRRGVAVGAVRHSRCLHTVLCGHCLCTALHGRRLHTALHSSHLCGIMWWSSLRGVVWQLSSHSIALWRLCIARRLSSHGCCWCVVVFVVVIIAAGGAKGGGTYLPTPRKRGGGFLCSARSCLNGRAMPLRDSGTNRVRAQTGAGRKHFLGKKGGHTSPLVCDWWPREGAHTFPRPAKGAKGGFRCSPCHVSSGLIILRECSIRTIIGTVFVHTSYFPPTLVALIAVMCRVL
jgi:hypothetical protein